MARILRSAVRMERAIGGGRAPSVGGVRALSGGGFAEVNTLVKKMKDRGVSSVDKDFVHQIIRCVNSARVNKIFEKATRAGLVAAAVVTGLTVGSVFITTDLAASQVLAALCGPVTLTRCGDGGKSVLRPGLVMGNQVHVMCRSQVQDRAPRRIS